MTSILITNNQCVKILKLLEFLMNENVQIECFLVPNDSKILASTYLML